MPEGLSVSPSALIDSANNIVRKISDISATLNQISDEIQKLPDSFKGEAATQFLDKYYKMSSKYEEFKAAMNVYADFLNKTSEAYAKTNTDIANLAQQYLDE